MSKIEYPPPLMLQKLQALERRLSTHHEKHPFIQDKLSKEQAGYNGIVAVNYFFHFINLDQYHVLVDIRLTNDLTHFFQIDILLLSTNFIMILEVKNIAGTLYFDTANNQCIRTLNGKEEGFPDPILQVHRQQQQLIQWLPKNKLPIVPIIPLVVISNPSTIIKFDNPSAAKHVIHAASLPTKVQHFEKSFPKQLVNQKEIKAIKRSLMKQNQPSDMDILEKYGVHPHELRSGVQCPYCMYSPMVRMKGEWLCVKCKRTSKDAHLLALKDYSLLLSNCVTNQQIRDFLHINSKYTATRIINSLKLVPLGGENTRKYNLDTATLHI